LVAAAAGVLPFSFSGKIADTQSSFFPDTVDARATGIFRAVNNC